MGLTHRSVGTHAAAFGGTRRAGERIVALAGNPNVGKSTVFNALTGMRQHTGNWAGKTVGCACGRCRSAREQYLLVDLPGTYSLQPHSAEEAVACDFVRGGEADAVVVVCDATCLERTLVLALQMHSVTPNTIVCVNLLDEARHKRIHIDLPALQAQLGMPVVGVTARKKKTLRALLDALDAVMAAPQPRPDGAPEAGDPADDVRRAEAICRAAVRRETPEYAARDRRLDRLLTSRATGYPIMLLGLAAVLWLTIAGANAPSEWLAHFFGWAQGRFSAMLIFLHAPPWLQGLLVDGMFRTLAWVVAVMLPPMAIFFPLFTLLEDAGYLPRVAYNLDRPFQACRACGKQALTMCMGLGCNAAGVVGCRIIDSERERLLAVLTNSLMPCNGRFPALIALMTMFFSLSGSTLTAALLLTAALVLCVGLTFGATWLLSVTVLRGKPSAFALELPPYRAPQVGQVLVRSVFDRTLFEGLQFPLDVWFEDHRVVHEWVARCRRIAHVEKVCYHYVQRDGSICHSFSAPKHYHFFLANFERFEFVRRQRLFEGRTEQDAICDKLVRNCLYNFREAMRRRHASDFAEAVADMRRKLARMYEVKAQLPPATRKRLRRVVKHYGWYYLTHFVFRKKR